MRLFGVKDRQPREVERHMAGSSDWVDAVATSETEPSPSGRSGQLTKTKNIVPGDHKLR